MKQFYPAQLQAVNPQQVTVAEVLDYLGRAQRQQAAIARYYRNKAQQAARKAVHLLQSGQLALDFTQNATKTCKKRTKTTKTVNNFAQNRPVTHKLVSDGSCPYLEYNLSCVSPEIATVLRSRAAARLRR